MRRKVFFGLITSEDKLKNLSKSHEDSNANSIDTDDASDIADLSSKQPIVSVAQWYSGVMNLNVCCSFPSWYSEFFSLSHAYLAKGDIIMYM